MHAMSVATVERRERRHARPSQTEADRRKALRGFETAVDAKIASAQDPSQYGYQEFAGRVHLVYLRHPEKPDRRITLLEPMGSDLVFQFERSNNGIKRTIFGSLERERIASRMLSLDTASALVDFIVNPWFDPIERTRIVTQLSPTERAQVEAKGLRFPEPQPNGE